MWRAWRPPAVPDLPLPQHITKRLPTVWGSSKVCFVHMGTYVVVRDSQPTDVIHQCSFMSFIVDLQWSPCGRHLAVLEHPDLLWIYTLKTKRSILRVHNNESLRGIAWDPVSGISVISRESGRVVRYNQSLQTENIYSWELLQACKILDFSVNKWHVAIAAKLNTSELSSSEVFVFDMRANNLLYRFSNDGIIGKIHWVNNFLLVSPTMQHDVILYKFINNTPFIVKTFDCKGLIDDIEVLSNGKTRIATTSVLCDCIYTLDSNTLKISKNAVQNLIKLSIVGKSEKVHYWRCLAEERDYFTN